MSLHESFNGFCQFSGKIVHSNRAKAWREAELVTARNSNRRTEYRNKQMFVYRCEHCGGFHLTSARQNR